MWVKENANKSQGLRHHSTVEFGVRMSLTKDGNATPNHWDFQPSETRPCHFSHYRYLDMYTCFLRNRCSVLLQQTCTFQSSVSGDRRWNSRNCQHRWEKFLAGSGTVESGVLAAEKERSVHRFNLWNWERTSCCCDCWLDDIWNRQVFDAIQSCSCEIGKKWYCEVVAFCWLCCLQ